MVAGEQPGAWQPEPARVRILPVTLPASGVCVYVSLWLQASNLELGNQSLLESVDDLSRKNEDLTQVWFSAYCTMLPQAADLC